MRSSLILVILLIFVPIAVPGQSIENRIVDNHYAYEPSGAGPFPALIAMPGCSGVSKEDVSFENSIPGLQEDDHLFRRHYRAMATRLRDEGYAVYLIDVHRAEGLLTACAGEIPADKLASYISAAISWVDDQPGVKQGNIHVIGWSMGGRGLLEWLHGPRELEKKVKSAIAVYPNCDEVTDLTLSIPTLMLLGGADDIAEPATCEEQVRNATAKDFIDLKVYPGARHGFDIEDAPPVIEIGGGKTIGYKQTAAEDSWGQILSFLNRSD